MRSLRFLLSRRWLLLLLAVVVIAYGTWWLGEWQFGRLADRKADNQVVRTNETRPPAPVDDVLARDRPVPERDAWRTVSATGTYDAEQTVVVRYQTRDGAAGVDLVVPLVTADGTALLVDRGWLATEASAARPEDLPAPPSGQVTITGWVRQDGEGGSTEVTDLSTRAVSSVAIGEALDRPVYGGFVELRSEDPAPATALTRVEMPDLGNGPHFFYGLQWWFFGLLAIGGFVYLAVDERRNGARRTRQSDRSSPPSTGTIAPETNDAAGDSTKVATRPNSSGSP